MRNNYGSRPLVTIFRGLREFKYIIKVMNSLIIPLKPLSGSKDIIVYSK